MQFVCCISPLLCVQHAAGSALGLSLIQLIRNAAGAKHTIVATAGGEEKLRTCSQLGADVCIDRRSAQFDAVLRERGLACDLIIDCVGASYFAANIDALALDGTMVCVGFLGGRELQNFDLGALLRKRATLRYTTLRTRSDAYKSELVARFWSFAEPRFASGQLRCVLHCVLPIEDARQAHELMHANTNLGKIVLRVRQDDAQQNSNKKARTE